MNSIQARFAVGQLVHHVLFDYRGVIFDVDACFSGTEARYEQVARSRPPKNKPWYHLLVHDAYHTTYVAERHLQKDRNLKPINHVLVPSIFECFDNGSYVPKIVAN